MGNFRDYKIYFAGGVYHIYNRGVGKGDVFRDEQDYRNFLYRLMLILGIIPVPKRTKKGGIQVRPIGIGKFEVISYCLMRNHFHFVIRQLGDVTPELLFRKLITSYVRYFNLKYERVGHLFQDNFKCKSVLEDSYLLHLSAYVHYNPAEPYTYEYSSMKHFLGTHVNPLVSNSLIIGLLSDSNSTYKKFLEYGYDKNILEAANLLFEED